MVIVRSKKERKVKGEKKNFWFVEAVTSWKELSKYSNSSISYNYAGEVRRIAKKVRHKYSELSGQHRIDIVVNRTAQVLLNGAYSYLPQ